MDKIKYMVRHLKHRFFSKPSTAKRTRLGVSLAKWKGNADSPVMLMIDDFTNAWVKSPGDETILPHNDWGGRLNKKDSIYEYINQNLFLPFPEIRTTFFTVIGPISQYNIYEPFDFAEPINYDKDSINFFRKVYDDQRFEIAYHGYNHGTPGKTTESFIQEWDGFQSMEEALTQINKGQEISKKVFGFHLTGGKYGGWQYNAFADDAIDKSGFRWWCRDWMPKDSDGTTIPEYYEPHFFGSNKVIALPSTVHGWNWNKKQIKQLLKHKQIISIEEHMGCLRPDNRIQTPNVYDDIKSLKSIFTYLKDKNVWHATGSQIADYAEVYLNTQINDIKTDTFKINYSGRLENPEATINIQTINGLSSHCSKLKLIQPDRTIVTGDQNIKTNMYHFNIKIQSGIYRIEGN